MLYWFQMAKNKKKLRKKLRHELLKELQTKPAEQLDTPSVTGQPMAQRVEPLPSATLSATAAMEVHHDAEVKLVKKEIVIIAVLFVILSGAMIGSKIFDQSHGWVLQFADTIWAKF